jgi:hypothetical protein
LTIPATKRSTGDFRGQLAGSPIDTGPLGLHDFAPRATIST